MSRRLNIKGLLGGATEIFRQAKSNTLERDMGELREAPRKQRLRQIGYIHQITLYGCARQDGKLYSKRIEIMSKYPFSKVHNAFLYEVMVRQDLSNPVTKAMHEKYNVLHFAKYKGIPKDHYLLLTWGELMRGSYEEAKGDWVEYDQVSP